jgi:GntR family transcriptional regulator/MocR family aminotransferase
MLARRTDLDMPRDVLNQIVLAEFLGAHAYDQHVRRMRAEYRRRREHLARQLASRVPAARLTGVPAGLQAVVELPAGSGASDADAVVAEGLRRGIAFRTLAEYAARARRAREEHPPAIVLGFGALPAARADSDIDLAVAAIEAGSDVGGSQRQVITARSAVAPSAG